MTGFCSGAPTGGLLPFKTGCDLTVPPRLMTAGLGWLPPCFDNQPVWVATVTVQDVQLACAAASTDVVMICVPVPCSQGVDAIYLDEAVPFRRYPNGVPLPNGNYVPTCGVHLGVEVMPGSGAYAGSFIPVGVGSCVNPALITVGAGFAAPCPDLNELGVRLSCAELEQTLLQFALYTTGLNARTPVFEVIIKCCSGSPCGGNGGQAR